jgi:hypothetical protein
MAAMTRERICELTPLAPRTTFDAADGDTPATRATSSIVTRRRSGAEAS